MTKQRILVLQGVPASGKSTYAREFVSKNKNYVIVSRDAIREARGNYWIPEQEDYISDVEEISVRSAIGRGLNVIIDATNLNPKTIDKWKNIASFFDIDCEFKMFNISYEDALKRDTERKANGKRAVGQKVLKGFFERYFPEQLNSKLFDNRTILKPNDKLPLCIICDIDGTVALRTGRSPYDYKHVGTDICDPRMKQLLNIIGTNFKEDIKVFFFSGRESVDNCTIDTINWLYENFDFDFKLIMRKNSDHRNDAIVKKEMYEEHIKDKYDVLCVFDDRNRVVDMWRELGLLCCQVYYGDF